MAFFRFLRYSWVALLSAGADWLAFFFLVSICEAAHLPSLMIARLIGGLVSFFANRHWTWGDHRGPSLTQQGRRFLLLYGFSYGLALALFSLFVDGFGLTPYLGKLVTDSVCFVVNFLVMNGYVFHRRDGLGKILRQGEAQE
jgi:putative flippase GtrA